MGGLNGHSMSGSSCSAAYLTSHWFCVDLAHVQSRVISLHTVNHQGPAVVPIVFHCHPRVIGHHVGVNSKYGFGVGT